MKQWLYTASYFAFKKVFMIYQQNRRRGFIIYIVCALAIGLFFLILGLNKFKSGAVLQLSKTVTQERMITVAQAAVNESLALAKSGINDNGTFVGKAVYDFWKSGRSVSGSEKIWEAAFSGSNLKASSEMAADYLGSKGNVSTVISLYATENINYEGVVNSYLGYLKIVSKVSCDGIKDAVEITEHHDLKIIDLSFCLLDKYVLFVKSFCPNINTLEKNFVIEGIEGEDDETYSFVYLGNRNYPSCNEYSTAGKNPPVLLDLDFTKDKELLGDFFTENAEFNISDSELKSKSHGNFFRVNQKNFNDYASVFNKHTDFHNTEELKNSYISLVGSARQAFSANPSQFGIPALILNDFNRAGGEPERAEIFWSILDEAFPIWKYHYGYTDYNHINPFDENNIVNTHPFSGLLPYFKYMKDNNKAKLVGGAMPALFGEARDKTVYVDGPVYARFFKVGFLDEASFNVSIEADGSSEFPVYLTHVSCAWEDPQKTFSGKEVGTIDGITDKLMSHPVDYLSINNFAFGSDEDEPNKDNTISGGILGYNVFHYLDKELKTVSNIYINSDDFLNERIKRINNEEVLDLDGITVIYGRDKANLNLSHIKKYRGKGIIICYSGNCILGNLLPTNPDKDYLKIWLMGGRFFVDNSLSNATIQASLISNIKSSNNSSVPPNHEGGFISNKVNTHIIGNLIIDSLFDMKDKENFKITHDPKLYSCDFPVRVSIGAPKSLYVLNYKGKD